MRSKISLITLVLFSLTALAMAGDRERYTETREETLAADRSEIWVDGGTNGGISVKAWDKDEIMVEAKIRAYATEMSDAEELAEKISIHYGDRIHAEGPKSKNRRGWSVSFTVHVPRESNLKLETHNGGLAISDVNGEIGFDVLNGGVRLDGLAGDVHGKCVNGGVKVTLAGESWQGNGLDVETTNGGVVLNMPEDYNTELSTKTQNGGVHSEFPVTVKGKIGRGFNAKIGDGGSPIKLVTVNGGVKIKMI